MIRSTLCVLAIGCGGGGAAGTGQTTPAASNAALEVSFQTVTETHSVAMGDTLHTGDKIALAMSVSRPAYLYVVEFFPDGTADVLFPKAGEEAPITGKQRIPAAGWFQLDAAVGEENVYVVASTTPLASADAAIKSAVDGVRASGKAPVEPPVADRAVPDPPVTDPPKDPPVKDPPVKDPPPIKDPPKDPVAVKDPPKPRVTPKTNAGAHTDAGPGMLDLKSRGVPGLTPRGLTRVDADTTIRAVADEHGVAVFRFWFHHVAR